MVAVISSVVKSLEDFVKFSLFLTYQYLPEFFVLYSSFASAKVYPVSIANHPRIKCRYEFWLVDLFTFFFSSITVLCSIRSVNLLVALSRSILPNSFHILPSVKRLLNFSYFNFWASLIFVFFFNWSLKFVLHSSCIFLCSIEQKFCSHIFLHHLQYFITQVLI